jgi:3-oxoacyl-[acyl-carrier-protein] synthase-1
MAEHPFMIDKAGNPMVVCADAVLPVATQGVERLLGLALPAAREALQPAMRLRARPRVYVYVGLPEARPGRPEQLEGKFSERMVATLSESITIQDLDCYPLGNASGLLGLEKGMAAMAGGGSELCLVGGVDSYLEPETLEWLDGEDRLHSETTIWGSCPAEGAGFCLLASETAAGSLGLPPLAELLAAASATEGKRIYTETVCTGEGLSEAFRKTLGGLPGESRVSHTICDMNGEPYRGNEYGFAMLRSNRWFHEGAEFSTPADCWGDMGAACGPLFAILAAAAMGKEYNPGPRTLLWASSDGGLRAAALLQSPVK